MSFVVFALMMILLHTKSVLANVVTIACRAIEGNQIKANK